MVTVVPTGARLGEKPVARGGCCTVRFARLSVVPSTVVTLIFAVTAPSGTLNWSNVGVLPVIRPGGTVIEPTFTVRAPDSAWRFVR